MSITVPGIGEVPVVWRPADLTGPDSDGHVGRSQPIQAIVHHRIVGSLETMTNSTFRPTTDDVLVAGERRVSSHFGIGMWTLPDGREELRIVQFVALENTAYTNGQTAADREACSWRLWIRAGRPPANEMTVTIEHEDNGATDGGDGRYVVRDEVIRASIELDRLLLTGDGARIRAAGIRCSDIAAAQLGAIVPSTETLVDHATVCPVSKPYCWRAIGDDPGFPQARYLSALVEDDMLVVSEATKFTAPRTWHAKAGQTLRGYSPAQPGKVVKTVTFATATPALADATVYVSYPGTSPAPVPNGGPFLRVTDGAFAGLLIVASLVTLDPEPLPPPPDCSDEIAASIAADRAKARIVWG